MLTLNYRDSRPIYGQIKDGLRRLIVTGALEPDEKLPSVRSMAMDLAINPNTIQRAYAALEDEGYLVTRPGVGAFAAAGTGEHPRQEALLKQFDATARELLFLGLTPEELAGRVTRAVRREEDAL